MVISESDSNEGLSLPGFLALWLCFVIAVVLAGLVFAQKTAISFVEVMDVVGVLASISLSALLAYLYLSMSNIQGQQKTIMANQERIMEAEHLPHLHLESVEMDTQSPIMPDVKDAFNIESGTTGFSQDIAEISLINSGNGIAKNLCVYLHVEGLDEKGREIFQHDAIPHPLLKDNSEYNTKTDKRRNRDRADNPECFIEPDEASDYWAPFLFLVSTGDNEVEIPFGLLMEIYSQNGVEEITVEMGLTYEDMAENETSEKIGTYTAEIDDFSRDNLLWDVVGRGNLVRGTEEMISDVEPDFIDARGLKL